MQGVAAPLDVFLFGFMAFLNPLFLLGLVAAAIPLVIHLFNFRRPRRVDFSTLTFVRELQKTTMQRVKLKQLLLLLLRTMAIAMLVLAFARPTLTGGLAGALGGRATSAVAIVLDNSASMTLRDSRGEYFEQARTLARAVASQMGSPDELHLMTTAGPTVSPASFQSSTMALEAIDAVSIGARARPIREMLRVATARLQAVDHVNKEVYLISDLQHSTLGDTVGLQIPEGITTIVMPVGERHHSNVAITDVRIVSRIIEAGEPVRLEATVRNYGTESLRDYTLSAFLVEDRVAHAPVDLGPGEEESVPLVITPQGQGWLGGRVEGEDDAFPRDNVWHFSLFVPDTRRVLLVRGAGAEVNYIRLALMSRESRSGATFDLHEITESQLPTDLGRFSEYDAIVLAGLRALSGSQAELLAEYVQNGGGLFVYPRATTDLEDLNRLFAALRAGRLDGFVGDVDSSQPIATFEDVDEEHVMFHGVFERTNEGLERPEVESPNILYAAAYTPGSARENTLIRLTTGHPFLQEIPDGLGTVLVLTVAPERAWGDLPVRGLFVPLVYRSLQYLSASESVEGENVTVGGTETLRLSGAARGESVQLVSPSGEAAIPAQRTLPGAVLVETAGWINEPGIYEVRQGDVVQRRIPGNLDRDESDLATVQAADLADQLRAVSQGSVLVLTAPTEEVHAASAAIEQHRRGVEIWNVFLMLALAFLAAEMIVARQWRPEAVAS